MGWKEFLKPDWRKVAITVLIVLFVLFYRDMPFDIYILTIFILPYILASGWACRIGGYNPISPVCGVLTLVGLALTVLCWYLLSCIIIWIYDKLRKK